MIKAFEDLEKVSIKICINLLFFRRWVVLTDKHIFTFRKEKKYKNPTERILI